MEDNGFPCLALLAATPQILRGLMSEVSDEDARWKPAPDRFSIAEVLAHLSHSEGHCYRMRVDRFLGEEREERAGTGRPGRGGRQHGAGQRRATRGLGGQRR